MQAQQVSVDIHQRKLPDIPRLIHGPRKIIQPSCLKLLEWRIKGESDSLGP